MNNVTWELYDLSKDWTQCNDVSAANPQKLDELKAMFLTEAKSMRYYRSMPALRLVS